MTARRRFDLGFLTFVPDRGGPSGARTALEDGLRLVQEAEDLGFDSAWVRVRHHEPFLSSPMTFFAAASQRTTRIRFGTGVVPMRYEDPYRLAEDAATVDLLSGGRLDLGISGGIPPTASSLDLLHGSSERGFAEEARHRTELLRRALAGRAVGTAHGPMMSVADGDDLVVTPHAPGLADRVWYGAGSERTASRAGTDGMHLQLSTLNTEETGEPFDVVQARQIAAFHTARAAAGHSTPGRTQVGRILLPQLDRRDADDHRTFLEGYRSGMDADGRPTSPSPFPVRFSAALDGSPESIVEALLTDAAVAAADGLVVVLPSDGDQESHRRILAAVAGRVVPHLR